MNNTGLSLYELTEEMIALDKLFNDAIDEETGELKEGATLEQWSNEIIAMIQNKSSVIVKAQKNTTGFIEAVDAEIKKLQALKKKNVNKQEYYKKYITQCMIKMGMNKLETPNGVMSLRKSKSVEILNPDLIPSEFITVVEEKKISKTDIKKAIEDGVIVDGAVIVENMNLNIK